MLAWHRLARLARAALRARARSCCRRRRWRPRAAGARRRGSSASTSRSSSRSSTSSSCSSSCSKLLYKPLLAKMEERTQAIKKSLEEAQAARAEAPRQQEEHAAQLRAAYAEAQAIRAHRAQGSGGGAAPARGGRAGRGGAAGGGRQGADGRRGPPRARGAAPRSERPRRHRWPSGSSARACATRTTAASCDDAIAASDADRREDLATRAAKSLRQGALRAGARAQPGRGDRARARAGRARSARATAELDDVLRRPWIKPADSAGRRGDRAAPGAVQARAGTSSALVAARGRVDHLPGDRGRLPRRSSTTPRGRVRARVRTRGALTDGETHGAGRAGSSRALGKQVILEETSTPRCWAASSPRSAASSWTAVSTGSWRACAQRLAARG